MSLPTTAKRLRAKAVEHGWTCEVLEGANEHLTLRLRRDGVLMLAFWEKGDWRGGVALQRADAGKLLSEQVTAVVECMDVDTTLDAIATRNRDVRIERDAEKRRKATEKRAAAKRAQESAR